MGYSVYVPQVEASANFDYTRNLSGFFADFGVRISDLDGLTRDEAAFRISKALDKINARDINELRSEYDSTNGWGDVIGAIKFLTNIRNACREPDQAMTLTVYS